MLLWPRLVCGGTTVPRSSPGPRLPKLYGRRPLVAPGPLLVSLFNVKWRFSAPAGDVEGSKLCLFSVIMPAKCVSSVSPRFHYRRVAFCFLPLATILESLIRFLMKVTSRFRIQGPMVTSNRRITIGPASADRRVANQGDWLNQDLNQPSLASLSLFRCPRPSRSLDIESRTTPVGRRKSNIPPLEPHRGHHY
jgi:hypothetical protein